MRTNIHANQQCHRLLKTLRECEKIRKKESDFDRALTGNHHHHAHDHRDDNFTTHSLQTGLDQQQQKSDASHEETGRVEDLDGDEERLLQERQHECVVGIKYPEAKVLRVVWVAERAVTDHIAKRSLVS